MFGRLEYWVYIASKLKDIIMTLQETLELENNIKLKNEAYDIYNRVIKELKLNASDFNNGRFKISDDGYNQKYIAFYNGKMVYQYRGLHFEYDVTICPEWIFNALKYNYKGVDHLKYGKF